MTSANDRASGWWRRRYQGSAAQELIKGLRDVDCFDGRLPEAFGGYEREVTQYPVQYPTACSPQAWSTGAPLLLIRTMLGLEPVGDHLIVDPVLPAEIEHLELLDIPGRWGRSTPLVEVSLTSLIHGRSSERARSSSCHSEMIVHTYYAHVTARENGRDQMYGHTAADELIRVDAYQSRSNRTLHHSPRSAIRRSTRIPGSWILRRSSITSSVLKTWPKT